MKKFAYTRSSRLSTWGNHFDSMTELKFAVSIMEEFAWLRSPVSMYFHPGTRQLTHFPRLFHHRYTPDFLIRHVQSRKAFLIEIKPRAFDGHPQLSEHELVANNYIRSMKFDWTYKVVFDDEIILTSDQLTEFQHCLHLKYKSDRRKWFEQYCKKMSAVPGGLIASSNAHIDFIMRGWWLVHRTT
jgi:hypothetical protein